jgi:hypothetical protein
VAVSSLYPFDPSEDTAIDIYVMSQVAVVSREKTESHPPPQRRSWEVEWLVFCNLATVTHPCSYEAYTPFV